MSEAPTHVEMEELGKARRSTVPRASHGAFLPTDRDPVAILQGQNEGRIEHLVPVRFGRMLESPFAFYRGAAAVMANDLRSEPVSGFRVVCCGDAHIANFGLYASPERRLLFDLNDFDEAGMAPWEWDVKRLAASVAVASRELNLSKAAGRDAVESSVRKYRETIRIAADMSVPERFYLSVDASALTTRADKAGKRVLDTATAKARSRTSDKSLEQLTTDDGDGTPVIVDQPPLTQHLPFVDLARVADAFRQSLGVMRSDAAQVLSQFRLVDYVLKVVGVGSVGTYCFVLLFVGPAGEPLFLQAKQASPSVLQSHGGMTELLPRVPPEPLRGHDGYRVVSCQRILQAQSDPFLGWIERSPDQDPGSRPIDFYWRQFRDMKGSVDLTSLTTSQVQAYGALCGALLARAHAQSPMCVAIAAYLGKSDRFDLAIAAWANSYADQTERDYERLLSASAGGEVEAELGL